MKRTFYSLAALGFGGIAIVRILIYNSYPGTSNVRILENIGSILGIVQILAVQAGLFLLANWVHPKITRESTDNRAVPNTLSKAPEAAPRVIAPSVEPSWKARP